MKKQQVGIVLLEFVSTRPGPESEQLSYKVSQLRNTIEWQIGQTLTRLDVLSIIKRTGPRAVDVIVKGLEFEE